MHQYRFALLDRDHNRTTDRAAPRRDREGEETSARLRNGDTQLGDLMYLVGDMRMESSTVPFNTDPRTMLPG